MDMSSGAFVDAELIDEVTMDHFIETQRDWRPKVVAATKSMILRGVIPSCSQGTGIGIGRTRKSNSSSSGLAFTALNMPANSRD